MKGLLQKGLNKLFLCIAAAILLAVIIFAGAEWASPAFSYAESEEIAYDISSHYVSFGEILSFDVSENGNIALIEKEGENNYFRLLSKDGAELYKGEISLTNGITPQIASFDKKVIIYNEKSADSDAYLKIFNVETLTLSTSTIKVVRVLTDEDISISYPFKGFVADEKQGLLIVNYGISLFWYEIEGLNRVKALNSVEVFDKADKAFDIVEVAKESKTESKLYLAEDNEKSTELMTFHLSYSYQKDRTEPFYYQKVRKENENPSSLPRYNGKIYYDAFAGGVTLTERGIEGIEEDFIISFGTDDGNVRNVCSFKEQDGKLFIADNGQKAIKIFNEEGVLIEMLATYGNGVGDNSKGLLRFDNPSLIAVDSNSIAVYDKGNSRILLLDEDFDVIINQPIEGEVSTLAVFNNTILYAIDSYIYSVEQECEPLQYQFEEKVLCIYSDGVRLNAFTKTNCYVYDSASFIPVNKQTIDSWGESIFAKERDYSKIIGGNHKGVLYLFDNLNRSAIMYKDFAEVFALNGLPEYESVACDIKGNLWFLKGNVISAYERALDSHKLTEYNCNNTFNCLRITPSGEAFALTGHTIASLNLSTASSETDLEDVAEYDYPCATISLPEGAWGYSNPDNHESVIYLKGDARYPLFKTIIYNEKSYYYTELCHNGNYIKVFLPESKGNKSPMSEALIEYVKYSGIDRSPKGYQYPSNSAPAVFDIERGVGYKVIGIVSLTAEGLGNDWYLLESNNQHFYVKKEGYVKDEKPFVEVERHYVRAKTSSSGTKIYIYATPSLDGEIIDWVTDGYKIELTGEFDKDSEFSEIRYNDEIAYILSANIQAKGLTAGQSFAIIFSIIIVGVTVALLVIAKIVKQRRRK